MGNIGFCLFVFLDNLASCFLTGMQPLSEHADRNVTFSLLLLVHQLTLLAQHFGHAFDQA